MNLKYPTTSVFEPFERVANRIQSGDTARFRRSLAGAAAVAAVTLSYLLLWWNRFAGLRSGDGEFQGGSLFLAGLRPYRDYFTASTPLTILKSAVELWIFGNAAIVSRACGAAERVILAILVYFWIARFFRARTAALAAIVTIVLSTGDYADPLASYNHDAILLGVAAGFIASYALDELRSLRQTTTVALLSGTCAGLCFCTKQTTGLGITAAVPVIACAALVRLDGWRKAAAFLAGYCAGWLLPALALFGWLASLGAVGACIHDIFVSGPAAKASHSSDFLVREIFYVRLMSRSFLLACIALAISWPAFRAAAKPFGSGAGERGSIFPAFLLALAAVATGAFASYAGLGFDASGFDHTIDRLNRYIFVPAIYYTYLASTLLGVWYAIVWAFGKLTRRQAQFCLYAAVSFSVAFMLSLSFPIFEAMMVPGIGLPVAALLSVRGQWRRAAVYAACAVALAGATYAKLGRPFGFGGLNEPPVRVANAASTLPQMRGFRLPAPIMRFVDGTLRITKRNTRPGDKIFTYPEMALFYGLSGLNCPTLTCSHNIDVVNDAFAEAEARRLLKNPPAVLIFHPPPGADLEAEELIWRHGKPSTGQRALIAASDELARQYRLAASFTLPPNGYEVNVYVRPPDFRGSAEN